MDSDYFLHVWETGCALIEDGIALLPEVLLVGGVIAALVWA